MKNPVSNSNSNEGNSARPRARGVLGWVGGNPPEGIFITIGRLATLYYFVHFLVILPVLGKLEQALPLPVSIGQGVLTPVPGGSWPLA